jgi:hypothetical protein
MVKILCTTIRLLMVFIKTCKIIKLKLGTEFLTLIRAHTCIVDKHKNGNMTTHCDSKLKEVIKKNTEFSCTNMTHFIF